MTTSAAEAENLGEVRLTLTKQPPPPPEERRPRVALLLIDCSASMRDGIKEGPVGPNNPQRWSEMRKGLQRILTELLEVSPGIEIRLRFFGTSLDCTGQGQVAAILDSPADVDVLMAKVPLQLPNLEKCATTALYESTVICVEQLRQENRQRNFDWWLFGVFSDGGNGVDERRVPPPKKPELEKKERDAQLVAMREEGGAPPLVWIVGPEAQNVANKGEYGPANIKQLGESIPKPPPRPTRFTLELAIGQPPGIQLDRAAKAGRHRIAVSIDGDLPVGSGVPLQASMDGASQFRVLTKEVIVRPGTSGVVELDLPQDVDRAKGASATLVFAPPVTVKDGAVFSGKPRVSFTFTADRTLPLDQWIHDHSAAERRGVKTRFFANPGQATSPQWVFKGPNGEVEREEGLSLERAFPSVGPWECEFTCTSESGEKLAKKTGTIEIIDADFSISPAEKTMNLGEEVSFEIVPVQGATSAATYTCLLDGKRLNVGPNGRTITLPAGSIDRIGQHLLEVDARSRVGDFKWASVTRILVDASPRIAIMPAEFVEGSSDVKVAIEATGDIGDSVLVYANDKLVDEYPVVYPPSGAQVKQLTASIPTADLAQAELAIAVRPKKEGACPEATARLKGRPAEIRAALKSPPPGTPVSAKGGRRLVLEPKGDQAGEVGDVKFHVALTTSGEIPDGDDLIAEEANGWTVSMPRRPIGTTEVHAKPVGGRLQPTLFPDGKSWDKIGSLEVVPEPQWIPFLLWLLGVLAALYLIWTALTGNEARRWIVQTTAKQPKPKSEKDWHDAIRVSVRDRGQGLKLAGKESLKPYDGWPWKNWLPRLPRDFVNWRDLESKNTTIFLWQIAQRHPKANWLQEAVARNPNVPIRIRGARPSWPFTDFPSNRNGHPWSTTRFHPDFTGAYGDHFSETYKLMSATGMGSLWVRVKQPRRLWWEEWMPVPLAVVALISAAYLAHKFLHVI